MLAPAAQAEPLRVMTDILPLQGLVAAVMGDTGTPDGIIPAGASPHDFALKPSVARQISEADVIFWVGPALSPWLTDTLADLAPDARSVAFLNAEGTHEHEGHADHKAETDDHADHEDGHEHEHEHGDEGDPHVWLDPENAQHWLGDIAETLAAADPENAGTYHANANATAQAIESRTLQITSITAALKDRPYMVYHDAYEAFEDHFGLSHIAAITTGHAVKPGAAKLRELQEIVTENAPVCLFIDTPTPTPLARQIAESGHMKIAYLDPLGSQFAADSSHYGRLLDHLATTLSTCLKP